MTERIVLASGSAIRQSLLRNAGIPFTVAPARVDEESIRAAMVQDGAAPRDIADALAEHKSLRASQRDPDALVIGCDQILCLGQEIFAKPVSPEDLRAQLDKLNGKTHQLLSAAVIHRDARPQWRHVGVVRLTMRQVSADFLDAYVARNWPDVADCVGGYKLEEEGARLFSRIDGDYFNVLGLPLLELVSYLTVSGVLPG